MGLMPKPVSGIRGNVDTDTIFNASGLDFDVLKVLPSLISMPNTLVQKRMRVRWDELSPTVIFHKLQEELNMTKKIVTLAGDGIGS